MGKIIAAILFTAAVFYAVYLLLGKKKITEENIRSSGRTKRILLTAALAVMSVLPGGAGGCKAGGQEKGAPPASVPAPQGGGPSGQAGKTTPSVEAPVKSSEAWSELASLWSGITAYSPPAAFQDFSKIGKDLDQRIESHGKLVEKLVGSNEIDEETGGILTASFKEIAGHLKREHSGMMCCDMTYLEVFLMETKQKSLERLSGLEKLAAQGALTEEAAAKVKADIARDLYFFGKLDVVEKGYEKSKDYKAWDSKVEELQKFYTDNKNVIAKTDPSFKAVDLIIKLLMEKK